jgi:hypothetical protein
VFLVRLVLLQIDKAVMRLALNSQVKLIWFVLNPFLFDNKNTIKSFVTVHGSGVHKFGVQEFEPLIIRELYVALDQHDIKC